MDKKELRGFAVDKQGMIFEMGRATVEKDHGRTFWLCRESLANPKFKTQKFVSFNSRKEVLHWFKDHYAEEVFEGVRVDLG